MQNFEAFIAQLQKTVPAQQVLLREPMDRHTTFKIGGPADCLVFPTSAAEVVLIFNLIRRFDVPFTVLGNGSNVLVLDGGVRGVVIKFEADMAAMRCDGDLITAGAGALLKDVCIYAARSGLTGLEFAVGIPGSIGGAVFMNAGAYDGEISQVIYAVTAVTLDGQVIRHTRDALEFGYRHSMFQENHQVICEVECRLQAGAHHSIHHKMGDLTMRREMKQPLEMPSAGSTFKRPPGHFAGTLIEQAGLKGFRVGGAQVSLKHAGFVVNAGGATAADVLGLIGEVQRVVYEKHGVALYPEVRTIGEP